MNDKLAIEVINWHIYREGEYIGTVKPNELYKNEAMFLRDQFGMNISGNKIMEYSCSKTRLKELLELSHILIFIDINGNSGANFNIDLDLEGVI